MSEPEEPNAIESDVLCRRISLAIAVDEQVIEVLAVAATVLRDADDPGAADVEGAIRTHRVGIIKQRAILGAAGIEI
ncbi:hypothetical protein MKK84_29410 [Methylobacterium sp. E-065]|uniref:hypothetical protein n=1 Tax=Methylobacterium sp. E-065 TaxID=2836583 RepID=UPI001FBAC543|nr:hypothetical protein [Methylobacterium sp. E-065]MCJ2021487.1 hypothetical protein [Methylobacterium sp. E-065]